MENRNIVMLKRHFVNFKNPVETTYYLNQCKELGDFEVIDATSHNQDPAFRSDISPMFIGPVITPDGVTCNVFETLWQCAKVYPCHAKDAEPTDAYFEWRNRHFAEPKPALNDKRAVRQLRHINEELGMAHSDTMYSLWFNAETGRYEHLSYVEARKKIYIPEYAKLVSGTDSFRKLKGLVDSGRKIALLDYDAFNLYNDSVKEKMYQKYLAECEKKKARPERTPGDYLNLNTMKDVVNCPFISVGHGFVLKALLQGDIEVTGEKVTDHSGILS